MRCAASTAAGRRCRNVVYEDGRCRAHQDHDPGRRLNCPLVVAWASTAVDEHTEPCFHCDTRHHLPTSGLGAFYDGHWASPLCTRCLRRIAPHLAGVLDTWGRLTRDLDLPARMDLILALTNEPRWPDWHPDTRHPGRCPDHCQHVAHDHHPRWIESGTNGQLHPPHAQSDEHL